MKLKVGFTLLMGLVFSTGALFAQKGKVTIKGVVLETNSKKAVEFATVMVADKQSKQTLVGGTTDIDGRFSIDVNASNFYVEISFIGFDSQVFEEIDYSKTVADLGIILLRESAQVLEGVEVRAEKSSMEFKLDKKVFNVGKDLSSTGASALEVLNNVPSVNVNIEGQVSLRGSSGVQILINGKPSILASEEGNALGTITAEMIEKIEVITNPSAKYEAEGTAGIINIVIKKDDRQGINGSVSLNTGIPHNHSVGLSLNRRTEKFNLFTQLGVGYRELPRDGENINEDKTTNTRILNDGTEYRNEVFYNAILGTDYHIDKNNVLTLSGSVAYEVEKQPSRNNFSIEDESGNLLAQWYREEVTEATNPKFQYELQYKRDFTDSKEHNLLFSAQGNFFGKDQSSAFQNTNILGTEAGGNQETRTNFKESKYTFILNYTKPFLNKFTLETGAQYLLNEVSNDYEVSDFENDIWSVNESLTNIFEYNQNVLGVYATGAYEADRVGVKVGLRVENTDLSTLLVNTNERNNRNFTNLFPSFHTSYKLSEVFSVQVGYSKRIFRPRLWDLNPFFNIRNNFSIRTGNPDLLPEFTDSYEITSVFIQDKYSLNFGVYYRNTTDVIERVSFFENSVNTFRPLNVGTNQSTGIEINGKYSPSKKISFNGDFNYNYFNRKGIFESTSFDFTGDQWSSKLTTKLKLGKDIDFEVTGRYQSKINTIQGRVSGNIFADLGLRKKILKGRGVFNFSVRDIFASRFRESETDQPTFYVYSWGRRGRFITFGFSYGFGKGEAMEFSGARRRH